MTDAKEGAGVRMVCSRCASEQVTREAWAEWDAGAQDWRLGAVFDHAWCHRCQCDTRIAERAS